MCRLFGLTAGTARVRATFWLLDAPDSLRGQSHRNPDGTGLGTFDEHGAPLVEKQPLAGYDDLAFAQEARERVSSTFVGHVRQSSGTPVSLMNTHPFSMDGRIFAHNGTLGDIERLEARLGADLSRVRGDTDSERYFALISREITAAGGDVRDGIGAALRWIAANLPVALGELRADHPPRAVGAALAADPRAVAAGPARPGWADATPQLLGDAGTQRPPDGRGERRRGQRAAR